MMTVTRQNRHRFQGAIFDLDGTLMDTLEDIASSMNRVLERHGLPIHPMDKYRYFVGDGAQILAQRVLTEEKAADPEYINMFLRDFLEEYAKNWDHHARLYPGIADMLDMLSSRGFGLGILSNKPQEFTTLCVKRFLNRWKFRAVLGERPGIPRKPAPDGAIEAAQTLDIDPSQCIYIGDTSIDMKTARSAGMFPIGVLWGFRDRKELQDSGAGHILQQPKDLLYFLEPDSQ